MQTKAELRLEIKKRVRKFQTDNSPIVISTSLYSFDFFTRAKTIFAYSALSDELPLAQFLQEAYPAQKALAFPQVAGGSLEFRHVSCEALSDMRILPGAAYQIPEPDTSSPLLFNYRTSPDALKELLPLLILTPGRAFTLEGARLGRGGGYYDRFFAQLTQCAGKGNTDIFKIGLCFSCQIVDSIPEDEHDVTVDAILTEKSFIFAQKK